MITVQETTVWNTTVPNHRYILSDDRRWMYGYTPVGESRPKLFNNRIGFEAKGRTFIVLLRTKDVEESNIKTWSIKGSKDNVYTVSLKDNAYSCTCPAHMYRHMICKHIESVK